MKNKTLFAIAAMLVSSQVFGISLWKPKPTQRSLAIDNFSPYTVLVVINGAAMPPVEPNSRGTIFTSDSQITSLKAIRMNCQVNDNVACDQLSNNSWVHLRDVAKKDYANGRLSIGSYPGGNLSLELKKR